MNIEKAKREIKNAVYAYTKKTASGNYRIPKERQRPLLLMGPPGIGKTAVIAQIAGELKLGLVAYTMTHHTRQSAIGLPIIAEREFNGIKTQVTEYTMSEIIAAVYTLKEQGYDEGLLFLDEINCVSETLQPAMLQFLQYKSFGGHSLPEGWIITAAGNPPGFNNSARELDSVTLDRLRLIDIEPDFETWRHYAINKALHPLVISYLSLKPENFCFFDKAIASKYFVTPRAWEDLSEILSIYDESEILPDEDLIAQYLRHPDIALDFSVFFDLNKRFSPDIDAILAGNPTLLAVSDLRFDERLCLLQYLLHKLIAIYSQYTENASMSERAGYFLNNLLSRDNNFYGNLDNLLSNRRDALDKKRAAGILLNATEEEAELSFIGYISRLSVRLKAELPPDPPARFRELILDLHSRSIKLFDLLKASVCNALSFVRNAFGERSHEFLIFITNLTEHSSLSEYCPPYFKELLERP